MALFLAIRIFKETNNSATKWLLCFKLLGFEWKFSVGQKSCELLKVLGLGSGCVLMIYFWQILFYFKYQLARSILSTVSPAAQFEAANQRFVSKCNLV